jgi:hypothetical protein
LDLNLDSTTANLLIRSYLSARFASDDVKRSKRRFLSSLAHDQNSPFDVSADARPAQPRSCVVGRKFPSVNAPAPPTSLKFPRPQLPGNLCRQGPPGVGCSYCTCCSYSCTPEQLHAGKAASTRITFRIVAAAFRLHDLAAESDWQKILRIFDFPLLGSKLEPGETTQRILRTCIKFRPRDSRVGNLYE